MKDNFWKAWGVAVFAIMLPCGIIAMIARHSLYEGAIFGGVLVLLTEHYQRKFS